jgi:hypothetical protein
MWTVERLYRTKEKEKDMSASFSNQAESRRRFLHTSVAGAVVGLLTGGWEFALPSNMRAQSALTPDAALAELMAGNSAIREVRGDLRWVKIPKFTALCR